MVEIRFNIKKFYFIFFTISLFGHLPLAAQEISIVNSAKEYRQIVESDSLQKMIELKSAIPSLVYDLQYATKNNFIGKQLYNKGDKTFLRSVVVAALKNVQDDLGKQGFGLKIWDAYRPYSITKKMWDLIGDERYVANPAKGSNHNRGLAVDVTLINLFTEIEVDMGTGYDNFSDTAHHIFKNLSPAVIRNRELLKTTMEKHGFKSFETEWWHYSWPNNKNYEVLDLPFRKLGK
jgi:D-alanyl-D-alanine dipeptidase